jgi:transcriptional regulator with XRE-family HTH domain
MAIEGQLKRAEPGESRHGAARRKLQLDLVGETGAAGAANVTVLNISTAGALLRTAESLRVGERIRLTLPNGEAAAAKVVWTSDDLFGCRFEKPISQAAFAAANLKSDIVPPDAVAEELGPQGDTLGSRLKAHRQQRSWSLSALAGRIGVSKPALWKWERDEVRPRPQALDRLAQVLGVTPSELVYGAGASAATTTGSANPLDSIVETARRQIAAQLGLDPAAVELVISLRV